MSKIVYLITAASLAAVQAQAATLFTEDFEDHTVGLTMNGVNGWSSVSVGNPPEPIESVTVGNIPGVLENNFGDGFAPTGPTGGSAHVNDAGISGGLDTNLSYVLTWTWNNLGDDTHGPEFGFRTTNSVFGVRVTMEGQFNANSGRSRFLTPGGSDGAGWPGDNTTNEFRIYIDSSTALAFRDGIQVSGAPMDATTMASINGIYWFVDFSGGTDRNAGRIDNIRLTDSTPVTADPVDISTVVVDDEVGFEFTSQNGVDYFLECSTNMVDWTRLYTIHGQGVPDEAAFDPGGFDSNKSYRVTTPVP
jgi:hypothetical protein